MGNKCRQFGEIWTCAFWDMQADRQTNRQTDTLITILRITTDGEVMKWSVKISPHHRLNVSLHYLEKFVTPRLTLAFFGSPCKLWSLRTKQLASPELSPRTLAMRYLVSLIFHVRKHSNFKSVWTINQPATAVVKVRGLGALSPLVQFQPHLLNAWPGLLQIRPWHLVQ